MPGPVNYFYKEGRLQTHTKPAFNQFKVLTVYGIIANNAFIFMHKIRSFPRTPPNPVKETIAHNAPSEHGDHDSCHEWLNEFNTSHFRNSVFFKAPLIYYDCLCKQLVTPSTVLSIGAYKNTVKWGNFATFLDIMPNIEILSIPLKLAGDFSIHNIVFLNLCMHIEIIGVREHWAARC